MRSFKLLLALILALHLIPSIVIVTATLAEPPREVAVRSAPAEPTPDLTTPTQRSERARGCATRCADTPPGIFYALLTVKLLLIMGLGAWLGGCALADRHGTRAAPSSAGRDRALRHLLAGTQCAGEFVILDHAAEDVQPTAPADWDEAVNEARRQDTRLELREVAGHWILRRPRV